ADIKFLKDFWIGNEFADLLCGWFSHVVCSVNYGAKHSAGGRNLLGAFADYLVVESTDCRRRLFRASRTRSSETSAIFRATSASTATCRANGLPKISSTCSASQPIAAV